MKTLFYIWAIFPIIWEVHCVYNTEKILAFRKRLTDKIKDGLLVKSREEKAFQALQFGYLIWIFAGLFSTQWVLFVLIFSLSFIPKEGKWVVRIDSAVTAAILLFIVVNAYHLHIDLLRLII